MPDREITAAGRREFLKVGGLATAAALVPPSAGAAAQEPALREPKPFPRRRLGKTGVDVTIVDQGTWRASGIDRLIRMSYSEGVRCFSTRSRP
jgi:hypothetical protein